MYKNVNIQHYNKFTKTLFFQINSACNFQSIKKIYTNILTQKGILDIRDFGELSNENLVKTANKLVHFGWKKEAIPISVSKKSLIAKLFSKFFRLIGQYMPCLIYAMSKLLDWFTGSFREELLDWFTGQ